MHWVLLWDLFVWFFEWSQKIVIFFFGTRAIRTLGPCLLFLLFNSFVIDFQIFELRENCKQKKQTSPKKSALFCFQRRERDWLCPSLALPRASLQKEKADKPSNKFEFLSAFLFAEREGFLLWQATSSITNPHSGVLIPSNTKKGSLIASFFLRRERDSNPRYLSVRRFSRPVQSTTLPPLQ